MQYYSPQCVVDSVAEKYKMYKKFQEKVRMSYFLYFLHDRKHPLLVVVQKKIKLPRENDPVSLLIRSSFLINYLDLNKLLWLSENLTQKNGFIMNISIFLHPTRRSVPSK